MSDQKFHHYVPRFYLARFTDSNSKIWVLDKQTGKVFNSTSDRICGQKKFYRLEKLVNYGLDPLELEKQFADLEYQTSNITNDWVQQFSHSNNLILPENNRDIMSLFIVTQLLRTVESREILVQFTNKVLPNNKKIEDAQSLHASLLWNDDFVNKLKKRISDCIWIFGNNKSNTPFCSSDNPVLIKSFDNKQWLLGPKLFEYGMYVVYPLSPSLILYCKDPDYWSKTKKFENSMSPVDFTDYMVNHENSGQIGMSYRFIFSKTNDFSFANDFLSDNVEFKNPQRERF